jgi:hypothetical protein
MINLQSDTENAKKAADPVPSGSTALFISVIPF